MFLSFFLITLFLIITLSQIYFLGKYFIITQEAFVNKRFAAISVGFIIYIFITFIFLIPFYLLEKTVNDSYITVILIIKDIFITVFLVNRNDIFKKNKEHFVSYLILILTALAIVALYKYLILDLTTPVKSISASNDYFLLAKINSYLNVITFSPTTKMWVLHFYIWPLLTVGILATITSFYPIFMRNKHYWIDFAVLGTVILLIITKSKWSLEIIFSLTLVFFLFQIGTNLITFARRRYSILFGAGVIATWALNNDLLLVLITVSFSFIFAYIIIKKSLPLLFAGHLTAPLVLILGFWIKDIHQTISIIILISIIFIYFSMFYFPRFRAIKNNIIVKKIYLILPVWFLIVLYVYSLIETFRLMNFKFIMENWSFIDANDKNLQLFSNIIYYIIFLATGIYSSYVLINNKKMIGVKLISLVVFLGFVITYNSLVYQAWQSTGFSNQQISNMAVGTIYPALMISTPSFIKKAVTLWVNKIYPHFKKSKLLKWRLFLKPSKTKNS